MEPARITSNQLARVVEQAGYAFEWSRSYQAVLGTTIGAVFAAVGLDEEVDSISVAPEDLGSQCRAIVLLSEQRGHSPSTGASYARSWRRLSTIAHRWKLEGGDDAGPRFWETVEDLRDTRPKRLKHQVPDDPGNEEPSDTFSVGLSTGRATVALPDGVTDADLLALVRAIVGRKR
jgi:hypothetical protein